MAESKFRVPIGPKHAHALGVVVACWCELEAMVEYLIWHLLGCSVRTGRIVTAELRILARMDLLFALASEHFKDDTDAIKQLSQLSTRIEYARIARNNLVHGRWAGWANPDIGKFVRPKSRRKWRVEGHSVTPDQMLELAEKIMDLEIDLFHFASDHDLADFLPHAPDPTS